ncbi:MAG: bile acid:sodium symporter family protein [Pseudomonadales bacterium]
MTLDSISSIGLPLSLAAIMLAMGLSLQSQQFKAVLLAPRAFVIGLTAQLVAVPLIALAVIAMTGISGALAVGLIALSLSPGGTTSNLFTQLCNGDVALSISLTTAAALVAPFTLPLATAWALQWQLSTAAEIDFPVLLTISRLLAVMLLPLLAGMMLNRYCPVFSQRLAAPIRGIAIAGLGTVIACLVLQHWGQFPLWFSQVGSAVALLLAATMSLGWILARAARLKRRQCKSICIEVGMQNGGTALLLTQGVLANPQMSSVPILYGLTMLIPIAIFTWRST